MRKTALSRQLADIDLKLLRVFKTVVDAGGFSAAEVELNLANSTICNYMADLEKRLDMRLCERGRAGFRVTEQGQIVYQATLDLLLALEQFQNRINHTHGRLVGQLSVGFAEHMLGMPSSFFVRALREFSEQAPDVNIQISTLASQDIAPAVIEGRIKLGISVLHDQAQGLNQRKLYDEQMLLYCGQGHPLFGQAAKSIQADQLAEFKFVESPRLQPGHEIYPIAKGWQRHASAYHQEARAALILTGQYLGYLPRHLVESWGWQEQMQTVCEQELGYINSYYTLSKPQAEQDPLVSKFMHCLMEFSQL